MHENNKFCDIHNGNTILYNNKVENGKNNIAIFDDNQIQRVIAYCIKVRL